ncbi:MAG: hypothetical protein Kow0099_11710 [Candidatus Abyssubacteria bacterium]
MRPTTSVFMLVALMVMLSPLSFGWAEADNQHGDVSRQEAASQKGHSHPGCRMMESQVSDPKDDALYESYFAIQSALANDSLDGVPGHAKKLAQKTTSECAMSCMSQEQMACPHGLTGELHNAAVALSEAKDLASARTEFGRLSEKMVEYHKRFGRDKEATAFICDMAKQVWLQETDEPGNPYYGPSMAKCARKLK